MVAWPTSSLGATSRVPRFSPQALSVPAYLIAADPCVRPASRTACYVDSLRIQMTEQDGRMVTGLQATATDGRTEQELRRAISAHLIYFSTFISAT